MLPTIYIQQTEIDTHIHRYIVSLFASFYTCILKRPNSLEYPVGVVEHLQGHVRIYLSLIGHDMIYISISNMYHLYHYFRFVT